MDVGTLPGTAVAEDGCAEVRVPTRLRDESPSARLIYVLLEATRRPLSQADVRSLTGLSTEATRRALGALEAADIVDERSHPEDGRKRLYALHRPGGAALTTTDTPARDDVEPPVAPEDLTEAAKSELVDRLVRRARAELEMPHPHDEDSAT